MSAGGTRALRSRAAKANASAEGGGLDATGLKEMAKEEEEGGDGPAGGGGELSAAGLGKRARVSDGSGGGRMMREKLRELQERVSEFERFLAQRGLELHFA